MSRKNNERRQQLEERLKSIVSQSESSRTDIIPRGYEEDREGRWKSGAEDSRERGKISDLKQCYEEETGEREKAELQVAELRSKLQRYERFETEYEKIKTELKEVREELKREQGKNRDFADFGSAKTQKLRENIEDLEGLIRRLKLDFERCKEDNLQLERSIKTADEQRSELLKECELLRQTLADLKKLHLRELEEMEKRLDEAVRDKNTAERNLTDTREERKATVRKEHDNLQEQIVLLEVKLKDLELKYAQQMTLNRDLQGKLQSLTDVGKPEEKLVTAFEVQMQDNSRRIQELQQRLDESRTRHYASDTDSELSNEELTAMVRKEQKELGLSTVLRPKNTAKRGNTKGKDLQRVYASVQRRRTAKAPGKRTVSRCKYCHE